MAVRFPFSPEILEAMPEQVAKLYRSLELTLLKEIADRLKAAGQLNEVTVQSIRALRSHGISVEEIKKAIATTAEISEKDLNKLFDDVVARNQVYYSDLVDLAKVTEPETMVDQATIKAIERQTRGELVNLTRSMGFLVDNGKILLPPAKSYQWALDSAISQIQSGAISYNQAIANATAELADSGLKVVNYESGHVDQVDVAVRRAVMTGINNINSQYAVQSMEYLEADHVEVTAHAGARNIDGVNGWENHERWQGLVYSVKAEDLERVMSDAQER